MHVSVFSLYLKYLQNTTKYSYKKQQKATESIPNFSACGRVNSGHAALRN